MPRSRSCGGTNRLLAGSETVWPWMTVRGPKDFTRLRTVTPIFWFPLFGYRRRAPGIAQSSRDITVTMRTMASMERALARPQFACSKDDQIETERTEVEAVKIRIVAEISRKKAMNNRK